VQFRYTPGNFATNPFSSSVSGERTSPAPFNLERCERGDLLLCGVAMQVRQGLLLLLRAPGVYVGGEVVRCAAAAAPMPTCPWEGNEA